MALPEHTRRLVESRLTEYCRRICPPSFERQVRLGFRIDGHTVTLFELKPFFDTRAPMALRQVPVARFHYAPRRSIWHFHYRDPRERWRRYPTLPHARDFLRLLREVDSDPQGLFWGRVNGASLRWCTSRGRCGACGTRYERIVGTCPSLTTSCGEAVVQFRSTASGS
jgi:hypothetical protein